MRVPVNAETLPDGRLRAVCEFCDKRSAPSTPADDGLPSSLPGWLVAPYPDEFIHADGSTGSTFTCPACDRDGQRRQNAGLTPLLTPSPTRISARQRRATMFAERMSRNESVPPRDADEPLTSEQMQTAATTLRRAATLFRRGATPADLDALAEAEHRQAVEAACNEGEARERARAVRPRRRCRGRCRNGQRCRRASPEWWDSAANQSPWYCDAHCSQQRTRARG
ncbi:hypothetical protein MP11Mi_16170 [Gordonia sp. MP11Mi]|uniref:Uncharacterized protein n=1 Tax=Gordonia sp. MP11Mi TaxID=3022769 RepID=A0AA97CVE4_9ACTN